MTRTVLLGDEVELAYGKGLPQRSRIPGSFPVYGSNGQVDTHTQALVKGPGIIVGRKGSVGEIVWSDSDFWPIDTTYYLKLKKSGNIKYWYYQLKDLGLEKLNSHSAIPGLNRDVAYAKKIIERSKEEQDEIAYILGSIDAKIELNRRMNETLEQIGQALYEHYFIYNPNAKQWGLVALGQKINPKRGKSLTSKMMVDGKVPVVSGGLQSAGQHNKSNTLDPVITISASGANAGFVALWGEPVWSADSSFIDNTVTDSVYFYHIFLRLNQDKIFGMQTGAAQPHIYPSHLELLEMPGAPDEKIKGFNEEVTPIFQRIHQNKSEIDNLEKIRDSLLPRLISGKIKA